ncbi:MAG TPA: hypothetical protein VK921_15240 [Anditalea sp.]|nr:hypothetical protein [Anditalea sp.]
MKTPFKESKAVFVALGIILLISTPLFYYFISNEDADEIILSEFKIYPYDENLPVEELQVNADYIHSSFLLFEFQEDPVLMGFDLNFEEGLRYILEIKNPNFREVLLYR